MEAFHYFGGETVHVWYLSAGGLRLVRAQTVSGRAESSAERLL